MNTLARRPARDVVLLLAATVALQAIVWAVLVALLSARVGYGLHDLSDIPHYLWFAERVDAGAWPYRDFGLEYPPLSLLTFLAPYRDGTLATYSLYFTIEMLLVCVVSALVVTLTAMRLWTGTGPAPGRGGGLRRRRGSGRRHRPQPLRPLGRTRRGRCACSRS